MFPNLSTFNTQQKLISVDDNEVIAASMSQDNIPNKSTTEKEVICVDNDYV